MLAFVDASLNMNGHGMYITLGIFSTLRLVESEKWDSGHTLMEHVTLDGYADMHREHE